MSMFSASLYRALSSKAYPSPGKEATKKGAAPAAAAPSEDGPHRLDIRVGKIVEVSKHPDADSLYVEKIDLGETVPRTIVSERNEIIVRSILFS